MWRIPDRIVYKAMTRCVLAIPAGIIVWTCLNYRFISAYVKGTEIPQLKYVLLAMMPLCLAFVYSAWQIVRYSPDAQASLRRRLGAGALFRFDRKKRCLAAFDRLIQESEARQRKHEAAKAAIAQLPDWKWGVKPVLIGFLAVFAASPLLAVAPIFIDSMTAKSSFVLGGVIWGFATLAYVAVRWLGILDERDRPRGRNGSSARARPKVSDYYQSSLSPVEGRLPAPSLIGDEAGAGENAPPGDSGDGRGGEHDRATSPRDLPDPPAGFEWKLFRNAVFLQPVSWHIVIKETPPVKDGVGMDVYATSPEWFSYERSFQTGFTIQVMSGMRSGVWPGAEKAYLSYLSRFMYRIEQSNVLTLFERDQGVRKLVIIRYRDTIDGLPTVIVHKFIVMSEAMETVHVYTFESPEVMWQQQWDRYGELMLRNISMAHSAPIDMSSFA